MCKDLNKVRETVMQILGKSISDVNRARAKALRQERIGYFALLLQCSEQELRSERKQGPDQDNVLFSAMTTGCSVLASSLWGILHHVSLCRRQNTPSPHL